MMEIVINEKQSLVIKTIYYIYNNYISYFVFIGTYLLYLYSIYNKIFYHYVFHAFKTVVS